MKITPAEAQIMEVLWRAAAPLSVEDLQAQLAETWADGTIRAFMNRLLRKRAVAATKDGKRSLYRPLLARDAYVLAESETLVDRLFDGRVGPLVLQFAHHRKLTPEDIADLERLIAELKNGR